MRSVMAVQEALLGGSNPALAEAYFRSRVQSFLAGPSGRAMSAVDFMGGPRLTDAQRADLYTPADGSAIGVRWNPAEGRMEYPELLPENVEAMRLNMRNPKLRFCGTAAFGRRRPPGILLRSPSQ